MSAGYISDLVSEVNDGVDQLVRYKRDFAAQFGLTLSAINIRGQNNIQPVRFRRRQRHHRPLDGRKGTLHRHCIVYSKELVNKNIEKISLYRPLLFELLETLMQKDSVADVYDA